MIIELHDNEVKEALDDYLFKKLTMQPTSIVFYNADNPQHQVVIIARAEYDKHEPDLSGDKAGG